MSKFSHNKQTQCLFICLLKSHQYLGYFPQIEDIPISIFNFFKKIICLPLNVKTQCSSRYFRLIKLEIQQYLDVKPFSKNGEHELTVFLKECAYSMADPTDLVNASIAELLRNHYSLPSFEVLERLVRSVRHQTHQDIYQRIFLKLSQDDQKQLNQLLIVPKDHFTTPFGKIKAYPNTAKFSNINEWKERLVWLNSLVDTAHLVKEIPFTKIKQFATEANVLEISDILDIASDSKRFTLLISLIHLKKMETKDDLVLMFIRRMKAIHNQGKRKLDLIHKEHQKEEEKMFKMSSQIAQKDLIEKDDADFGKAIRQILANYGGSEYITNSYEMSSKYHDQNHHSLLWKIHVPYRKVLWEIIDLLDIQSSTEQNDLLASLKLFDEFKNNRKRVIEDTCFPLSFTSQKWKNSIIKINTYDRQLLELCLLSHLAEDLQSTDLFVTNSLKYADYRTYLLPMDECLKELNSYCEKVEIPAEPTSFIQQLQNQLHQKSEKLAKHFKGNELLENLN